MPPVAKYRLLKPVSPVSLKPNPAVRRLTARRFDQLFDVIHIFHSGQVCVLHSGESLSLTPCQVAINEVALLRSFGQKFRLKNTF